MTAHEQVLEFIRDDTVVGLGTGRAADAFLRSLGARVRTGLRIRGVPTSQATARLASELRIPLVGLEDITSIDVAVDGADEVDPQLNLIKGYGGALLREKIVASAARRLVILVGPDKLVPVLGHRGVLPVEVVPFALGQCARRLDALGCPGTTRIVDGRPYVTDNGNYILHCAVEEIGEPAELELAIRAIPGVVTTGLFIDMADTVIVDDGRTATVRRRGEVSLPLSPSTSSR